MDFITLGAFVLGFFAWVIALVLKPFGFVDIAWNHLLIPIYLVLGAVVLFVAGVFGLWFVFWLGGVL